MIDHNYILQKLIDHGLLSTGPHFKYYNCRGCQKVLDIGYSCSDCSTGTTPYRVKSGNYWLHPFVPAIYCSSNSNNNQLHPNLSILLNRLFVDEEYPIDPGEEDMSVIDAPLLLGARRRAARDINGARRRVLDCLATGDFTSLATMQGEHQEATLFRISIHVRHRDSFSIATHHLNQMMIVFQSAIILNHWRLVGEAGTNEWGGLTENEINGRGNDDSDEEDDTTGFVTFDAATPGTDDDGRENDDSDEEDDTTGFVTFDAATPGTDDEEEVDL